MTTIKQRFKQSIICGTGEAFILMTEYPDIDFSKHIINAALKNHAFDPQCENSRAPYIWQFIFASPKREETIKAILDKIPKTFRNNWDADQQVELLSIFCKHGSKLALAQLNKWFKDKKVNTCYSILKAMITVRGVDGLLEAVEIYGTDLRGAGWEETTNWLCEHFENEYPRIRYKAALQRVAKKMKMWPGT